MVLSLRQECRNVNNVNITNRSDSVLYSVLFSSNFNHMMMFMLLEADLQHQYALEYCLYV